MYLNWKYTWEIFYIKKVHVCTLTMLVCNENLTACLLNKDHVHVYIIWFLLFDFVQYNTFPLLSDVFCSFTYIPNWIVESAVSWNGPVLLFICAMWKYIVCLKTPSQSWSCVRFLLTFYWYNSIIHYTCTPCKFMMLTLDHHYPTVLCMLIDNDISKLIQHNFF